MMKRSKSYLNHLEGLNSVLTTISYPTQFSAILNAERAVNKKELPYLRSHTDT